MTLGGILILTVVRVRILLGVIYFSELYEGYRRCYEAVLSPSHLPV